MEKIFDLREFLLDLYQKSKISIIIAVVLGMVGATYAMVNNETDVYISQAASSINLMNTNNFETDGLDIIMGNIRETVTSNYFYITILNELSSTYDSQELRELFQTSISPNINDLRNVLNIYTSGNNVIIELKAKNSVVAQKYTNTIREVTAKKLAQNIQNITITIQDQYVYNQMLQTGNNISGSIFKYTVLGICAGIVISIFYQFFFNVIDTKVKSIRDLEKYNLPIFGEIVQEVQEVQEEREDTND